MHRNVSVRLAKPSDAPAITRLIAECYGGTHPLREVCDPAALARGLADGSVVYALAYVGGGAHVGQACLERRGAGGLVEYCRAIIDERARGLGVLSHLSRVLLHEVAAAKGARFVLGRPVTTHVFTQANCRTEGFVDAGLLFGVIPASTVASGIAPPEQPTSMLVQLLRLEADPAPRGLALRGADGEMVAATLDGLGIPVAGEPAPRAPGALGAHFERDRGFGVVHLRFARGAPPRRLHESFVDGLFAAGTRVLWADVPIEDPDAPELVARLREIGLSYATYLPVAGAHGEDVLRLQRFLEPAPFRLEPIQVIDRAMPLRDRIFAEARLPELVT